MSDDLVKRLTEGFGAPGVKVYYSGSHTLFKPHPTCVEAADRIKALKRQVTTLSEGWRISDKGRIESESKLAKALEALSDTLEILADDEGPEVDAARATLAELKGKADE